MQENIIDPVRQLVKAEAAIIWDRLVNISKRIEELENEPKNRDGFKCLADRLKRLAVWVERLRHIQSEADEGNLFPALREATETFYDLQGFALSRRMGSEEPTRKDYEEKIADCEQTILFGKIRDALADLIRKA